MPVISNSPDSTPPAAEASDRRRATGATADRRNAAAGMPGVWTDGERARFIAQIREARHDAQAKTIQAGAEAATRAPGETSRRRVAHIVRACALCGATHLGAAGDG